MLACDWVPDGLLEAHSPGTGLVTAHQFPQCSGFVGNPHHCDNN